MKVIKSDTGTYAYQKLLKHVHSNSSDVVVWQVHPESGERNIFHSLLNAIHLETGYLHFELKESDHLNRALPVFFYAEDGQFIFRSDIQDVKAGVFTILVPKEIKLLEDEEVTVIRGNTGLDISDVWRTKRLNVEKPDQGPDIMVVKSMSQRTERDQEFLNNEFESVSLDEEDKLFADKRESPRARPKVDKLVKVAAEGSDEDHILKLFDLSRGGIGFITLEPELFPKGSKIRVLGFEDFDLDDPLIAMVMSQRPIDETQIEFKIGCKFDEGQA